MIIPISFKYTYTNYPFSERATKLSKVLGILTCTAMCIVWSFFWFAIVYAVLMGCGCSDDVGLIISFISIIGFVAIVKRFKKTFAEKIVVIAMEELFALQHTDPVTYIQYAKVFSEELSRFNETKRFQSTRQNYNPNQKYNYNQQPKTQAPVYKSSDNIVRNEVPTGNETTEESSSKQIEKHSVSHNVNMKFCGQCGTRLKPEAVFCHNCGGRIMEEPVNVELQEKTSIKEGTLSIDDSKGKYAEMQNIAKDFLVGRCIEISTQGYLETEDVDKRTAIVITVYGEEDKLKDLKSRTFFAMKADYDKYATPQLFFSLLDTATWRFDCNKKANKGAEYGLYIGDKSLMNLTYEDFSDETMNCLCKNEKVIAQSFMACLREMNVGFNKKIFPGGTRVIVPFENVEIVCEFTGQAGRNMYMSIMYAKVPQERIFDVYAFCGDYNEGPHITRCNVIDFNGERVFCIERKEELGGLLNEAADKAFFNLEMLKNDVRDIKMQFYRILLR